ncbi:MAG: divalent-cation tolerance protein CutA [Armatimonadetes bacterium]|nr:divalent-cation tolerance protein CutA [Armatimonadota bacterium]MDW8122080.1 divalent-cation tolerance protein CutA [Armatimonadota bacterium]
MSERIVLIYSTVPNRDEAVRIARSLVANRLCACVNIGSIQSVYQWQGEIQEDQEFSVLVKTTERRLTQAVNHLLSLHPYQTPAVLWWYVDGTEVRFADWIRQQAGDSRDDCGSPSESH